MANPAQQPSAPPRSQRDHAASAQEAVGVLLVPGLQRPPALPSSCKRPTARWVRFCLIAANAAASAFFLLSYSRHGVSFGPYRIDLNVYRTGSAVWLRGGDLYGALPPTSTGARLPFSYPPIAAVLLAPLALAPRPVAVTLLTTVTIALTALVLRVFLRSVIVTSAPSRALAAAPHLLPAPAAVAPSVLVHTPSALLHTPAGLSCSRCPRSGGFRAVGTASSTGPPGSRRPAAPM